VSIGRAVWDVRLKS